MVQVEDHDLVTTIPYGDLRTDVGIPYEGDDHREVLCHRLRTVCIISFVDQSLHLHHDRWLIVVRHPLPCGSLPEAPVSELLLLTVTESDLDC